MTGADRDAAYALLARYYDGTDRERFDRDLDAKTSMIQLRDANSGGLKGFSTIHVGSMRVPGSRRTVMVMFSGDTVVDRAYWGQKMLHTLISRLMLQTRLRHPVRPLYWLLISKGWKTYKIVLGASRTTMPRHDVSTPAHLQRLIDFLARERFGDSYDPATGIVHHLAATDRVRDGIAPVTDELLTQDPHVAFFLQRNPGHAQGDELVCIAPMTWTDMLSSLYGSLRARRDMPTA